MFTLIRRTLKAGVVGIVGCSGWTGPQTTFANTAGCTSLVSGGLTGLAAIGNLLPAGP